MTPRGAFVAALATAFACGGQTAPIRGIETRTLVDRTEATVGDPVGVTIEIDTPEGFKVEPPAAPPADEQFLTERVERLDPVWLAGGVRHRLVWSLRARTVGEHRLPELSVPLSWPDGRLQRLPVGGTPLPVRSVREGIPARDAYFDIRPAPPLRERGAWAWLAAAALLAVGIGGLALRRRRGVRTSERRDVTPRVAEALARLASVPDESPPRALAEHVRAALRDLIRESGSLPGDGWTPEELPSAVDPPLVDALRTLEGERFSPRPRRDAVVEAWRAAQAHLIDVARRS